MPPDALSVLDAPQLMVAALDVDDDEAGAPQRCKNLLARQSRGFHEFTLRFTSAAFRSLRTDVCRLVREVQSDTKAPNFLVRTVRPKRR